MTNRTSPLASVSPSSGVGQGPAAGGSGQSATRTPWSGARVAASIARTTRSPALAGACATNDACAAGAADPASVALTVNGPAESAVTAPPAVTSAAPAGLTEYDAAHTGTVDPFDRTPTSESGRVSPTSMTPLAGSNLSATIALAGGGAVHCPSTHASGKAQSGFPRHGEGTQAPPTQISPGPVQGAVPEHATARWQWRSWQYDGGGVHSASTRHLGSSWHTGRAQSKPGGQTSNGRHSKLAGHSWAPAQGWYGAHTPPAADVQYRPAGQSANVAQLERTHAPSKHTSPPPHVRFPVQRRTQRPTSQR